MKKDLDIAGILNFINKKWIMVILKTMHDGQDTFTGIKQTIGDINQKILSTRLSEMEEEGFIMREIVQKKPIKIRYSLTKKGKSFCAHICGLLDWQKKWAR
ncbi:helix-turn-helix transcriptional regulator [Candidatus Peribacteria bacterium]|nr:helix-turn-helix transcriptional regulator [Candidatus Peribacteria bacterium]